MRNLNEMKNVNKPNIPSRTRMSIYSNQRPFASIRKQNQQKMTKHSKQSPNQQKKKQNMADCILYGRISIFIRSFFRNNLDTRIFRYLHKYFVSPFDCAFMRTICREHTHYIPKTINIHMNTKQDERHDVEIIDLSKGIPVEGGGA